MMVVLIKDILTSNPDGRLVDVYGWVRTKRDAKNLAFIQVNDGSCFASIQLTFDRETSNNVEAIEHVLQSVSTGASIHAKGKLIPSPASGQAVEVALTELELIGPSPSDFPLQKKHHTVEFLREIAHLRPRTNLFGAMARMRSEMAFAVHNFFHENGFFYVHTPIITTSDCEGAGEMFQVTTLDFDALTQNGKQPDYTKDFFGKKANLTVSGQLEAETYATAISRIYTFGPTFRAENSNTPRHLAEFWMIEPEMAFYTLNENMDLAESFIKYMLNWALKNCSEDMKFFDDRVQKGIIDTLETVYAADFERMPYTEAISALEKSGETFEYKPFWGCDLQTEHERFLTEKLLKKPVIITDYPAEIKAFYMKQNPDGKTVRAMDVLVPGIGEIIGGSQREDDLEKLVSRMVELKLNPEDYWWYLDLRKYGSVPHSGFGLGFERMLRYVTGIANLRDVIPFPRAPKLAEF